MFSIQDSKIKVNMILAIMSVKLLHMYYTHVVYLLFVLLAFGMGLISMFDYLNLAKIKNVYFLFMNHCCSVPAL